MRSLRPRLSRTLYNFVIDGIERYKIDCTIVTGNSGGPVVDEQDRVIGIAVKGNESFSSESASGENLVIPISLLHK